MFIDINEDENLPVNMIKILKRRIWISLAVTTLLIAAVYLVIPDVSRDLNDFGLLVLDRDGEILRGFLNEDEQWCFIPQQKELPAKLTKAVLCYEDRWFWRHFGFNPLSIMKALSANIRAGKVVSGGSTITMQVCRIAKPGKRTVFRKLLELVEAIKLEIKYSKKEILGFYLHNAPYGGNIQGIRAASLKYFLREPAQLSWSEAALLAILPNSPALIAPGRNQQQLITKRNQLLDKLHERGIIDDMTCHLSKIEPAPDINHQLPCKAEHFTRFISEQAKDKKQIKTTIDTSIQELVERSLDFRFPFIKVKGIANCAAVVIENKSCEVLAWVGSQDYYSPQEGQVDGVLAERSPGSTLKPFLYGLSIDEGLIVPQTMLHDIPTYYPGFIPENYSRSYTGWVTAKDALIKSLNVPAVRLLNMYSYQKFYHFLQDAGLSTLFRTPDGYGLTLVLGGCEVKMLELAGLYCGLANYGKFRNVAYLADAEQKEAVSLISPGTSWQVLNMLSDLQRPGAENYWHQYDNQWKLAWKTGTSYGHRDAWAVGVNPQYTIAVWSGNFTGESNSELSGAATAGPLLFSIFNSLPKNEKHCWFDMPVNALRECVICAETGLAPSRWCPRDTILVAKEARPLRFCHYHQPFEVTQDGSHTVCSLCWSGIEHHQEIFLVYPPRVKKYLKHLGMPIKDIPPHLPGCSSKSQRSISIDYPREGAVIFLPRDLDGRQQKLSPEISGFRENSRIYWYLDDEYAGVTTGRENIPLLPSAGKHTLSLVEETGNTVSTSFTIILPKE